MQVKVHFNAEEAIAELERLGQLKTTANSRQQNERISPVPMQEGYEKLRAHWDRLLLRPQDSLAHQH